MDFVLIFTMWLSLFFVLVLSGVLKGLFHLLIAVIQRFEVLLKSTVVLIIEERTLLDDRARDCCMIFFYSSQKIKSTGISKTC